MARPLSVAIVGAGMGGLATAVALRRIGVDVMVYEQASQFARIGAQGADHAGAGDLACQHLAEGADRYELGLRLRRLVGAAGGLSLIKPRHPAPRAARPLRCHRPCSH
ncbi:NAD(P)-binding protein [Bradyrhizobium diazoefficiens]|nr:NAD(P)-binding protein [Bradyrhizobium diazoefficiens]